MRRTRFGDDDVWSDENMNQAMQHELNHLRAKYLTLQKERNSLTIFNDAFTRINEDEINSLLAEQNHLKTELQLASSSANFTRDQNNCSKLEELLITKSTVYDAIKQERSRLGEINMDIGDWEERVKDQRETSAKIKFQKERQLSAAVFEKRQKVLESRLHLHITKFNHTLARNYSLTKCIDTLRNEKRKFLVRFKALSQRQKTNHAQITQILDRSINMYEQTEDIKNKRANILDKCEKDRWQRESDMKELELSIAEVERNRKFMQDKANQRGEQVNKRLQRERALRDINDQERREKLLRLEEAWKRVTELILETEHSAESRADVVAIILDKFKLLEENHFSVYSEVNFQNDEISRLQMLLAEVSGKLPKPKEPIIEAKKYDRTQSNDAESMYASIHEHGSIMSSDRSLTIVPSSVDTEVANQQELAKIEIDVMMVDREHDDALKTINDSCNEMERIIKLVPCLFTQVRAEPDVLDLPLRVDNQIGPVETGRYLGAIEERVNNIILSIFHNQAEFSRNFKRFIAEQNPYDEMSRYKAIEIAVPSSMDLKSLKVYTTCKTNDAFDGERVSIDVDDLLEDYDYLLVGDQLDELVQEHMAIKERIIIETKRHRRSTIFGDKSNRASLMRGSILS